MAWTVYQTGLALLMVSTGTINTLSTKWADMMNVTNSVGEKQTFNHPFLQASGMFLGEILCYLAFKILLYYHWRKANQRGETSVEHTLVKGNQSFNPFIFLPAAICDMTGTSLMYVGLTMTYAASFQMFRGAVIIFTGLLSVIFLRRRLQWFQWLGIVIIIVGLVVVGLSDVLFGDNSSEHLSTRNIITGDLIIIVAQVIAAVQMVYEEKFIVKHNVPPLQVVGWEGMFGFIVLGILLIPMYFIPVGTSFGQNPRHVLEDALDGFAQLSHSGLLVLAVIGNILSIAFFNFAGVSVTKELSATTRMVLDSIRTLVIWVVTLLLSWQKFHYLQVVGFIVLVAGMCLYNDVIILPLLRRWGILSKPEPVESDSNSTSKEEDLGSSRTHLYEKESSDGIYTIDYS